MPTSPASAEATSRPRRRRARATWVVPLVLLVLLVAGAVAVGRGVFGGAPPAPDPVVLPAPTPTVRAAERERRTAFQSALPDEVLAYAVADQREDVELRDAGAVEAYLLTYTDGVREVTLRAGQWATAAAAVAVQAELAGAEPAGGQPVLVRGREVGRVLLLDDGATARALWTNGATLFTLRGPRGVVPALYDAFPM